MYQCLKYFTLTQCGCQHIFAIFAQKNPIYAKYFNNESGTKAIRILTKNKAYDYNVRYN